MTQDTIQGDITRQSRIERLLPERYGPFIRLARLDRPVGIWLLVFPCWWSMLLARPTISEAITYGILFLAGAILMRSAGCIVNDILDRDLDGQVARTRGRPLPAGEITLNHALLFLFIILSLSFMILLQFNILSIALGVAALGPVCLYPLMKRCVWWPQAFLGITFNWGALIGWSAIQNNLAPAPLALYLGAIFWTLGYDTIYAHQDREDDALIGVRSTARYFGTNSPVWVGAFNILASLCWLLAGWLAGADIFWSAATFGATAFMMRQLGRWDMNDPQNCLQCFRAHRFVGWILSIGALSSWIAWMAR